MEIMKALNSSIQALFTTTSQKPGNELMRKNIERALGTKLSNIARIEIQSATTLVLFCKKIGTITMKEVTLTPMRAREVARFVAANNREIRVNFAGRH